MNGCVNHMGCVYVNPMGVNVCVNPWDVNGCVNPWDVNGCVNHMGCEWLCEPHGV